IPGALAVALATRMVTTDLLVWTWIALALALAMVFAASNERPANAFLVSIRRILMTAGPILGAGAVLANLELAIASTRPQHDVAQVAVYLILAAALVAVATFTRRSAAIAAAAIAAGIALLFGTRALDGDLTDAAIAFSVLAWAFALAAM